MRENIIKEKTTLVELLTNNTICIPIVQRDYAQGRLDKVDLRKRFLSELKNAIDNHKEYLLDFIFGTEKNGIQPLDGQQRLTTLWLLHWYAAFSLKKEKDRKKRYELLSKFSYETRISSREFIELLCKLEPPKNGVTNVSQYIESQSWFCSSWKQDPTIKAMLIMLSGTSTKENKQNTVLNNDGIEQLFKGNKNIEILFTENCPIKFYYLSLVGIKHSDDLYIRMNHRGKQLSSFENFKADFISFMKRTPDFNKFVQYGGPDYVVKKLDIDWADKFWSPCEWDSLKLVPYPETDQLLFSFIIRYLVTKYILVQPGQTSGRSIEKMPIVQIYDKNEEDVTSNYSSFSDFEKILAGHPEFIDNIDKILSHSINEINKAITDQNNILKANDFQFLVTYNKERKIPEITTYNKVVFYGVCRYFEQTTSFKPKDKYFSEWLRVLTNIAYSREIENFDTYVRRLRLVEKITSQTDWKINLRDALSASLGNNHNIDKNSQIIAAELEKLEYINKIPAIKDAITKVESLNLFSGWIDCLYADERDNLKKPRLKKPEKKKISDTLVKRANKMEKIIAANSLRKDLLPLLKAIVVKGTYTKDISFYDKHNDLRVAFNTNDEVRNAFISILDGNDDCNTIISNFTKSTPAPQDKWKMPLVDDNNGVLWAICTGGKFVYDSSSKEMKLLKGVYVNNSPFIPLGKYYDLINPKGISQKDIEEMNFNGDSCEIKNTKWEYKVDKDFTSISKL